VILLERTTDRLVLRRGDLTEGTGTVETPAPELTTLWSQELPLLPVPRLRIDVDRERWELASADLSAPRGTRLSGTIGGGEFERTEWELSLDDDSWPTEIRIGSGERILSVVGRFGSGGSWMPMPAWFQVLGASALTELSLVGPEKVTPVARSATTVWCAEPEMARERFVCASFDHEATRLWSIDPENSWLEAVGQLPGLYYDSRTSDGKSLVLASMVSAPVWIDLESHRSWTLDLDAPDDGGSSPLNLASWQPTGSAAGPAPTYYSALAARDGILAVAEPTGPRSHIRTYLVVAD
jgi:hypothetical protein